MREEEGSEVRLGGGFFDWGVVEVRTTSCLRFDNLTLKRQSTLPIIQPKQETLPTLPPSPNRLPLLCTIRAKFVTISRKNEDE